MTQWWGQGQPPSVIPRAALNPGETLKDNPRQDFNLILNLNGVVSYSVR
ncbi:MAG: hypothetical protein HLUCCO16_04310 [Phormidium sp. OSCR]|jgi:hypothetical protein|nr:MAG: hypothetical protein HLUCCO16_04310 [Phormidium sp. OSCR]